MAEGRKPFLFFRPRFILFCLYVVGYVALRHYGEIIQQAVDKRVDGVVTKEYIVASALTVPRWRRQLYRASFSPLMVVEEEVMRVYTGGGNIIREFVEAARGYLPD